MVSAAPAAPPISVAAPTNPKNWSVIVLPAVRVNMTMLLNSEVERIGAIIEGVDGVPLINNRVLSNNAAVKFA